ncbi:MAG TPA: GNAT family N-acetyltransferase [Acidobacteriaceae bacterium]|jgi:aminoglycoside 6'-N-acetyltransferase-1b/aminoglycoside 6'-N-acetyltransferase-2|nr:GNAT family N-acetyltransferase [Acidobacteriaceae bacterium]
MRFERLSESDLATLKDWLGRPHVAARWAGAVSMDELREEYLPGAEDASAAKCYLAYVDDVAVGFIQSYVAMDSGDGWWPEERDPGVRGVDLFVADEERLGEGLGTLMLKEFAAMLFEDAAVTKIQGDPSVDNPRAIRCCERAGFQRVGKVMTPDGETMLMVMPRP